MTDTAPAVLRAVAGRMTAMSSYMTGMGSWAYPGGWAGALSRATTRKGGPGVYTPGPLRHRPMPQGEGVIHSVDRREWINCDIVDPKGQEISAPSTWTADNDWPAADARRLT